MFWVQILIACGDNDGGENDDEIDPYHSYPT